MIKFIKILLNLSKTIKQIEGGQEQFKNIEIRIHDVVNKELREFEEKIKKMSFNYTANLDDTKSDYLKRYVESRLDCLQETLHSIPRKLSNMQQKIVSLEESIGQDTED